MNYKKLIRSRDVRLKILTLLGWVPDKIMLKLQYRIATGKKLDLKNPKSFNEKLQWLKIHDRKDVYTAMVDKYEAKKYVADRIGEEHIIPTIGIYDDFDEIDFKKLPSRFVIKCTHDSGGVVICKNKKDFDILNAKKTIEKRLKKNAYYYGREWPYKNVKPRIIVEKYMEDESGYQLKDYKVFCFNGKPELIMVDSDRFSDHKRNVYDTKWDKVRISLNYPNCDTEFKKPKCLTKMLEMSKKLSKGIPFIRTDFYVIDSELYFGELTFFPGSGFQIIQPESWQIKLGDRIRLPKDCAERAK